MNKKESYYLKQQLAEKDKEHELLIDKFEEETEKLIKQIKQESDARKRFVEANKQLKQLQNQTAIAELEKVKEYNRGLVYSSSLIDKFIDKQIKSLKGDK